MSEIDRENAPSIGSYIESEYTEADSKRTYIDSGRSGRTEIDDYRILWIRDKIMKFLALADSHKLFNELINANNREIEEKLLKFLNIETYEINDLEYKQVFFYKTYRDEIVQEEVSIWEEGRAKIAAMGSFAAQVKSQRLVKSAPDEKSKKKAKKSKKSKPKGERDESIKTNGTVGIEKLDFETALRSDRSTGDEIDDIEYETEFDIEDDKSSDDVFAVLMRDKSQPTLHSMAFETEHFEPPPGEEDNYILTRKVVDRVIKIPILHCLFGELNGSDPQLNEQRLIYFIRSRDAPVPTYNSRSECWAKIPRDIIVGSIQGNFIDSMSLLLKSVFLPLAKTQFRGPEAAQDKAAQIGLSSMMETPGIERAAETLCDLRKSQGTAFAPPSSMRRVSLLAEKMMDDELKDQNDNWGDNFGQMKKQVKTDVGGDKHVETSKMEFLDYLSKLVESVEWTQDHVEADTMLTIPEVFENMDPAITDADLAKNRKLIEKLEEIVMSWEKHIKRVLESYTVKTPQGNGPITEYLYWHDRESGLSLLVEQLRSPAIARILGVLNMAESAIGAGFSYFDNELSQRYEEAKENNKFLSTVLRYFKIMEGDSMTGITKFIPSLYEHLRMIWVLSKYYSTEERMISLLERISWQLRQTVMRNLSIKKLFEKPLETILKKTNGAHKMLQLWKQAYLDTRNSIELSGKGDRWEFDQRRLFKDTDYLASSSANLNEIAGVLRDFYNIFGEELKSIVSDPARIDAIKERVSQLLGPILISENDAFNEYNRDSWEATVSWFRSEVQRLEAEAKVFIDECFVTLIRAEDALAMLIKFRNMKTREAVQERLAMKFDIIMQQFSKEIDEVEGIFNKCKKNPALLRYHPPIAGAIYWERQLFHRMKSPVLIFQDVKELKNSELKKFVFEQYITVAKQMKNFEDAKFEEFVRKVQPILHSTLRSTVLTLQPVDKKQELVDERTIQSRIKVNVVKKHSSKSTESLSITASQDRGSNQVSRKHSLDARISSPSIKTIVTTKGTTRSDRRSDMKLSKSRLSSASTLTEKLQQQIVKNLELMRGAILIENQMKLTVNFNAEVFEFIREAELLEHLGFELPESIREVGIQKYRLYSDREEVEKMINHYNDTINKFDDADILLLKTILENVEKNIQPGVTRLNWYSLSIADYASSCNKLLKGLSSLVTQINQIRHDLDANIDNCLSCYNLYATSQDSDEILPCKAFFTDIENKRTELVSMMLKCYHSMSPMLIKLESLVESTSTGKSHAMLLYYERYEHKLFTAFITCFVKNLEHLKQLILGSKPIFQVNATIIHAEVALKPSAAEIYTMIMRNVKDLMERLKVFPRWMARSCLECKPMKKSSTSDFMTFSFYEDVMGAQTVNELIFSLQDTSHRLVHDCHRYLQKWKQYSSLWSTEKLIACEKFATSNATLQQYDEKFSFYASIIDELDEMTDYYDISSIRINLRPLLSGIKDHALEWKKKLGEFLLNHTLQEMNGLKASIDNYRIQTEYVINGLEKFKIVMQSITYVKRMAIQAEVKYLQYQETFKILRAYNLIFSNDDEEFAHKLQKDWESLYLGALYRFASLESTKDQFREMTMQEIKDFGRVISEFVEKFHVDGPGSCGEDLDTGMQKMEDYGTEMNQLDEKLADLTNAELLFDLSPADYSNFKEIKREYEAMSELYKMYKAQKIARDNWAKTLWVDLNPQKLLDGMEAFLKDFRKLSKFVRNHGVGRVLEKSMKSFKDSVPLFVELKNEAMRERHWRELMNKTGKHFDMARDRLDG